MFDCACCLLPTVNSLPTLLSVNACQLTLLHRCAVVFPQTLTELGWLCLQVPLERLLLETDAPDGKPHLGEPYQQNLLSFQGQGDSNQHDLNHPANIRCVHCCTGCCTTASRTKYWGKNMLEQTVFADAA